MSGPTLFLLPGVIRRPACGARLGPWCQPQAGSAAAAETPMELLAAGEQRRPSTKLAMLV